MNDVAALAGVSLKSVSRVVNGEQGVSSALAERVNLAAAELGYRPNMTARSLRSLDQLTNTVGLVVQDVSNEFFGAIHRGVEDRAQEGGAVVVAISVDRDFAREEAAMGSLVTRRVDGVILSPTAQSQDYLTDEISQGLPVVCIDRRAQGISVDTVVTDNSKGAQSAVEHLIGLGHRRIAFMGGQRGLTTSEERHAGYRAALVRNGLPPDPRLEYMDLSDSSVAERALLELFADERREEAPTAVFTGQNRITMGVVRGLKQLGIHDQVALIGFDDFSLADLFEPSIAVVAQDPRRMGYLACDLLFNRLAAPQIPAQEHVVPTALRLRSSGNIPAPFTPRT